MPDGCFHALFQTSLKSNQRGVPLHGTNASTLIDFNSRPKFTSTPARPSGDANAFFYGYSIDAMDTFDTMDAIDTRWILWIF